MEKSTQISTAIKYQKKVLNIFAYQQFYVILFLEQVKTNIFKCFQKNVNMLLKKNSVISILLMMQEFLLILMKKLCWKKFRWKNILIMKKTEEGLGKTQMEKNSDEQNSSEEN